jgi:cysteine desulfurase
MIFLDYASNYPVKKEVLDSFVKAESIYFGNANSLHPLGKESFEHLSYLYQEIKKILSIDEDHEIEITSSATESNNMVIKGLYESHYGYSGYFLSSEFEHSSVNSCLAYLKDKGARVDMVKTGATGKMDIGDLKIKCKDKPLLTCLTMVESEVGTIQDYHEVADIVHQNEDSYLLLDATQAVGKMKVDFNKADFTSFAPHKFGGIIGTGVLVRKKGVSLTPLIHGGKSFSIYRSSTPSIGLAESVYTALKIAYENMEENHRIVNERMNLLVSLLKENKHIQINSFLENPYIVNISYKDEKAMNVVNFLSSRGVCVSQKSACSIVNTPSKVINAIYHDKKRAMSSFRISLSESVSEEEIRRFIEILGEYQHAR